MVIENFSSSSLEAGFEFRFNFIFHYTLIRIDPGSKCNRPYFV